MKTPTRSHYSYKVYSREDVAEQFDHDRFGGPVGQMIAERQETMLLQMLESGLAGSTVLDVGTGTGRAAFALARRGGVVTACDASEAMLSVARRKAMSANLPVIFHIADVQALPFPDKAYDTVACLRVLMHVPTWREAVRESCRVARQRLVFDVPLRSSFAVIEPSLRRLMEWLGMRDIQIYRVFRLDELERALMSEGFKITAVHREFVLPLAFHRLIGSRRFSEALERGLARIGVRRWFGAPATILAERVEGCGS